MRRFVSADLTRDDIETLRTEFKQLQIQRIWKNLSKRALIAQSSGIVQARPAHLGYGAKGKGITWAVLDTGIAARHPHFRRADGKNTVIEQWDCTQRGAPVLHKPGQNVLRHARRQRPRHARGRRSSRAASRAASTSAWRPTRS